MYDPEARPVTINLQVKDMTNEDQTELVLASNALLNQAQVRDGGLHYEQSPFQLNLRALLRDQAQAWGLIS